MIMHVRIYFSLIYFYLVEKLNKIFLANLNYASTNKHVSTNISKFVLLNRLIFCFFCITVNNQLYQPVQNASKFKILLFYKCC